MTWQWEPLALPALVAFPIVLGLASWLYGSRPQDALHRRLALYLAFTAFGHIGYFGVRLLLEEPASAVAAAHTFYPFAIGLPLVTALAIRALPGAAPVFNWVTLMAIGLYTIVSAILFILQPGWFTSQVTRLDASPAWSVQATPLGILVGSVPNLLTASAAVIATSRHCEDPVRRQRLRVFRAGFLAYIAWFVVFAAALFLPAWANTSVDRALLSLRFVIPAVAHVTVALILGLGLMRTELVDIRSGLRTVAANSMTVMFLSAVFFAASESLERLVPFQNATLTIFAACAIALVMRPLQDRAEGVADRLIPAIATEDEEQRWNVYRDAIATAWADGELQDRDIVLLGALRDRLGLDPRTARRLEREGRPVRT